MCGGRGQSGHAAARRRFPGLGELTRVVDEPLGLTDLSIVPHLDPDDGLDLSMPMAERWSELTGDRATSSTTRLRTLWSMAGLNWSLRGQDTSSYRMRIDRVTSAVSDRRSPFPRLATGEVCARAWWQTSPMEQRISLVTLGVRDLDVARDFYEAMGWRVAHQPDAEVCFFQAGSMVFGLWAALGGHGAPGIELAYNVRSPEEVGATLGEAERAGATILRPSAVAPWGGTSGAFADPDGDVWEVAHNPGWVLRTDGSIEI